MIVKIRLILITLLVCSFSVEGVFAQPMAVCKDGAVKALNAFGSATVSLADVDNGSTPPNAPPNYWYVSPSTFNCSQVGPQTVTLYVYDDATGLTDECNAMITIVDDRLPTITCPPDLTLEWADGFNTAPVPPDVPQDPSIDPAITGTATVMDNCASESTFSYQDVLNGPDPVNCPNLASVTRTWTVTDAGGNTDNCVQTITLSDTTAPDLTCPGDQTGAPDASCMFTLPDYTGLATVSDNSDPAPVTIQNPLPGTVIGSDMPITLTATDACGNSSSCVFNLDLLDSTPPSITCPVPVTVECSGDVPAIDIGSVTATDNCGATTVTHVSDVSDSGFAPEIITRTYQATDGDGNSSQCTQSITVHDTTAPGITCPGDQTGSADELCNFDLLDYTGLAGTSDNCDPAPVVSQSPAAGTGVSSTTLITLTSTDLSGNSSTCTFNLILEDNIPPVPACVNSTVTFTGESEITLTANDVVDLATSTDNCSAVSFVSANPATVSCGQVGSTVAISVTVQDAAGNTAGCTSMVTVDGLPCGFVADPNGVGCPGGSDASFDPVAGTFDVTSDGCFPASPFQDGMAFVSTELCGNGVITAHIASLSGTGFAGIVMRESSAPGSKKLALFSNTSNRVLRDYRTVTNGPTFSQHITRYNISWVRIVRTGNLFFGYVSPNGVFWQFAFSTQIYMAECLQVGLASYGLWNTVTASFDNVSITPTGFLLANPGDVEFSQNLDKLTSDVQLFPNPAREEIFVRLNEPVTDGIKLQIYNATGQLVREKTLDERPDAPVQMSLDNLNSGIYMMVVDQGDAKERLTKKFIIQGD